MKDKEFKTFLQALVIWINKKDWMVMLYGSGLQLLPPTTEETILSNSLHREDERHYQGAMTRVLENSDLIRELAGYL